MDSCKLPGLMTFSPLGHSYLSDTNFQDLTSDNGSYVGIRVTDEFEAALNTKLCLKETIKQSHIFFEFECHLLIESSIFGPLVLWFHFGWWSRELLLLTLMYCIGRQILGKN